MTTKRKLVCGVGVNDAEYATQHYTLLGNTWTRSWVCPFYLKWKDMLTRCYSTKALNHAPTYDGCSVTPDWLTFSNFRKWMARQDWENKQLDKDILVEGNKLYSPNTCVFVDKSVNVFLTDRRALRGSLPIGVSFKKVTDKYSAHCSQGNGKKKYLGYFDTPEKAHQAWKVEKLRLARILAEKQTDERVAKALVEKYSK